MWQQFSCLLHEEIAKIDKKFDDAMRADQDRAKQCCPMGWIGSAMQQVAQKAIMGFQFLPSSSRHEKYCRMLQRHFKESVNTAESF